MKTGKSFYLLAAITLLGFIGYATAASNIPSSPRPFQYGVFSKLAELGITDAQKKPHALWNALSFIRCCLSRKRSEPC
jgi:hypothetical protein